jgi:DNA-binding winged helix-turn-helix (wHTH) protein/TolB-like protein/thioredoxin-like negative regulator of GroEL
MRSADKHLYEFGPFRLDPQRHRLSRAGDPISLPPKAVEALTVLVRNPGRMMERDEIIRAVWADAFVEDANLTVAISQLRKALSRNDGTGEYIQTVPRVGYRFVADVREIYEPLVPLIVEKHTVSRTVIEEEDTADPEPVSVTNIQPVASTRVATEQSRLSGTKVRIASAVVAAALLVAASVSLYRGNKARSLSTPGVRSIAVLPFRFAGGVGTDNHAGLGVADILITRLTYIRQLTVRPTSAILAFEDPGSDSINAGRQLGVDAVLEGSIYEHDGRVRVTALLVRVQDKTTLWSDRFEEKVQEEWILQDDIALHLVNALSISLSSLERDALTKQYTRSPEAYQLYVKGRYQWNRRNSAGMAEADKLFRSAIEIDPQFALAYAGLADTIATTGRAGEAWQAASKAMELDPNLAEAHATWGFVQLFHSWEWKGAEQSFRKSIDLNPGYATAHQWYAILLGIEGRNTEAKAEMQRALDINPVSYNFLADMGQLYYFEHQYDKAEDYCLQSLGIYPQFVFAHIHLNSIYLQTGQYDKAVDEDLKVAETDSTPEKPSDEELRSIQRYVDGYREIFKKGGIKAYEEQYARKDNPSPDINYARAKALAFLGEKEKALDNLERAYRSRVFLMAFVKADPVFDKLRDEPRFQAIVKGMKLE